MAKKKKKSVARITVPVVEMASRLEDHDAGPDSSPYLSPACHLIFENNESFTIPLALLEPIPKLSALLSSWNNNASLDFPQEAGHVLVHYLHTGRYQMLRQGGLTGGALLGNPLEVSLCAYSIAQMYEASGLTKLAKERVVYFSDQLTPLNFLLAVKGVSRWLASRADDTWLYDLVRSRVHTLFEEPRSLDREAYLDLFEPPGTLSKMLSQAMVEELCCLKTSVYTPSISSGEAAPLIPETPEPVNVSDELQLEPELPEPPNKSNEILEQPMEPEPGAELREDTGIVATQSEFTEQAEPSSLWPDELRNPPQAKTSPAPTLSKKDKKRIQKKLKPSFAGDCPDHRLNLIRGGDGWKDCVGCMEVVGRLAALYAGST